MLATRNSRASHYSKLLVHSTHASISKTPTPDNTPLDLPTHSNYRTRAKSTTATSAEKGRGIPTSGVTAVTKEDTFGKIAPNITLATIPRKNHQQPTNGCDKVEFPNSQNLLFNRVFYQLSSFISNPFFRQIRVNYQNPSWKQEICDSLQKIMNDIYQEYKNKLRKFTNQDRTGRALESIFYRNWVKECSLWKMGNDKLHFTFTTL